MHLTQPVVVCADYWQKKKRLLADTVIQRIPTGAGQPRTWLQGILSLRACKTIEQAGLIAKR